MKTHVVNKNKNLGKMNSDCTDPAMRDRFQTAKNAKYTNRISGFISAFFTGTAAKRRKRRKINCWETVRQRQPVSVPSVHFCGNLVLAPTLAFSLA
jgi:hypothetical protein